VTPPPALRVDGGMVENDWLVQFIADVCGIPVERPANIETTVLGAAYLAGLGSGLFSSLSDIEAAWRLEFRATPEMANNVRSDLINRWLDAVRRTRS